ncbi:hypothetical protein RND71_003820 [Anisodus tanguticus]|uniref:Uncharacterized protein n=1 Tax=Anisodus tanguticus TaxID=243964 RepID=A0AAE1SX64_9SOLA|nr:hypothetical protein RND71_003820 [Anisodus tanguticus]
MASSIACVQFSAKKSTTIPSNFLGTEVSSCTAHKNKKKFRSLKVVAALGDVSSEGTNYLIAGAGAAAVALLGTAFPILFSRKDTDLYSRAKLRKGDSSLKSGEKEAKVKLQRRQR